LALWALAVGLAAWGQYQFARRPALMWDGLVWYALAAALFVALIRGEAHAQGSKPRQARLWQALYGQTWRLAPLAAGLGAVLYVSVAAGRRANGVPCWDLLALWGLGVAGVIAALARWRRGAGQNGPPGPETTLLAALALGTLLLRVVQGNRIPTYLNGDEAAMGLEALAVLQGRLTNPFATGWLSHPTLYFFIQAVSIWLIGATPAALRFSSALASAGIVILLYLFARRYYGRWVALLAALSFAAYHFAIHYGRLGLNNIWDPFFALGALYGLEVGLADGSRKHLLAGGLMAGLSIYFYMGARLIPFIGLALLIHWAVAERGLWRRRLSDLAVYILAALAPALPLLAYFARRPADMMARWSWLGIFPSGWVAQQVEQTGRSTLSVLVDQFLKAALSFNYTVDPSFHYRPGIPLFQFVPSVFFVFGLAYALAHWRRRGYFILAAWLLLDFVLGGMLLMDPPWSPRLVIAIPPALICMVLGVVQVCGYVQRALRRPQVLMWALSLALVLATGYGSLRFYFHDYTAGRVLRDPNNEVANDLGRYLRTLGPDYQCYFFGAPRVYVGHPPIPFLSQGARAMDVAGPPDEKLAFVDPTYDAVFVILPERMAEMETVRRRYPQGALREFRDERGEMRFTAYEVRLRQ
jgi:hypothetical protein